MGMMPAAKSKDAWGTLKRLVARLRPEWPRILLAALLTGVSVAFLVIGPRILGDATNVIFNGLIGKMLPAGTTKAQAIAYLNAQGHSQEASMLSGMNVVPGVGIIFNDLGRELGLAAGVYLLGAVFTWAQGFVMAGVTQRTMYGLRREVETKLARLPLRYFDSHPHGDILSRVTNDIDNLTTVLQQGLGQLLNSVLTILGVLVMMFLISPILAAVSVVIVPLSMLCSWAVIKRSQKQFTAQWEGTGDLNGHVEEMHTGHELVAVFGRREAVVDEFHGLNEKVYRASFRAQFLSGIIQPVMQLLANVNYVVIAAFGGYRIVSGQMSLGDVQAFIQYSRQFTMPITQVASQMNMLQSGLASAERVFEFLLAEEEEPDVASPLSLAQPTGRVSLENVHFRYEPAKPLIADFNLEVEPGDTIAIVGPTGAGKTTIVNLLMRFYEIEAGWIKLDGISTRQLTRDTVRSAFGMVLQDTWLFAGTIRENIAYGKEGASDEEVVAAAAAAHADGFIRTLPEGYATALDEDASNISSGQRQLLTIARAFISDPSILILDEATSNVDTRTEVLIQEAMARLRHGRTSFVIAHRLSTIRNATTIIVMDQGRIVEHGSHAELMRRHGFYYDLYQSQFEAPLVEAG
ncbi:MAG TPA: ABC transporter ATP-binding protein [Candidatus Binatia bacterium]|nr:ABC transporter ATP-binding protein [Candidatus Binatia bacterium]